MSIAEMREKREKIIATIQALPEEKLALVEAFIKEINSGSDEPINFIYNKAIEQYYETLQKLAQ